MTTPASATLESSRPGWGELVERSTCGSVFLRPEFLDALDVGWEVRTSAGDRPSVAAPIFRGSTGEPIAAPLPFTLYQGPLISPMVAAMPAHRQVPEVLSALDQLLDALRGERRISFCLHHAFPDARPFSWFNYHAAEAGQFRIDLRYTGIIPLEQGSGMEGVLGRIRTVRRQEYRKAGNGFGVESSTDVDLLDRLHELTFSRQGLERSEREARLLGSITRAALTHGFGELLIARDPAGRAAGAVLYLFDRRAGYYLVAANDPEFRRAGTSTLLFLSMAERSLARGLQSIDVVGMNSPSRGDFKASFGAVPTPYYVVTWERP